MMSAWDRWLDRFVRWLNDAPEWVLYAWMFVCYCGIFGSAAMLFLLVASHA